MKNEQGGLAASIIVIIATVIAKAAAESPPVPNFRLGNEAHPATTVVGGIDLPTSVKFIGNTAYVVSYTGEIWKIENLLPPRGPGR